ncbi:amino acid ABC transporter permease [Oceanimonas baumannii]|uniref:ABC transporter permease n=1 Tax=Oceanimonas baumannii TaxID=129578 RepID=A0A235CFI7_9GAMM|nr:amino acid ABC transporter permease [Oceanimonas baumannii]MCC4264447.1 amino acid ABC transporter permease [Oceanimonas baumannii]OYD22787.1 ABC transporter permease [Oceanimonas baumannii]TDW57752.1 putative amino-acid transport system permease protein [Oceanimonas baumannii]
MQFDIDYTLALFPILLKYLGTTMEMALLGFVFALIIAGTLAVIRTFELPGLNALARLFISFFRGTPLLVQLFLLYYGLPQIMPVFIGMNAFTAAVIGLTLHFAAYMAESIRAAILGIHKSQMEAAMSIGMTRGQAMKRIILPQAARIATPSLMNYFIDMIKSTSLAFTLGVAEIMASAQKEASSSFKFFESFIAVALIYWAVVVFFTHLQGRLERRLNAAY